MVRFYLENFAKDPQKKLQIVFYIFEVKFIFPKIHDHFKFLYKMYYFEFF
jgi:hypothetical protein